MAVKDVTRGGVELALEEFRAVGPLAMLEVYRGDLSKKWYVEVGNWRYDLKLVVRAAHWHERKEYLHPVGSEPNLWPRRDFIACHRHKFDGL